MLFDKTVWLFQQDQAKTFVFALKIKILPLTMHTKVSETVDQAKTLDVNRALVKSEKL